MVSNSLIHSGVAAASLDFRVTEDDWQAPRARVRVGDSGFRQGELFAKLGVIDIVAIHDRRRRSDPERRGYHLPVHLQIDRKPYRRPSAP